MDSGSLRELLAQREFLRFWCARVSGITANQMLMVAVAWQMYDLTSSAWDLGLVGLFQFVPALVMTLPAGHLVDRWHRGRIFGTVMALQALVALVMMQATQQGFVSRELILGLSVLLGFARAFQMPAQQALAPLLVPTRLLSRAVAMSSTGLQAAVIMGPAVGGLLYVFGASVVYVTCAVLLVLASALAFAVRYVHRVREAGGISWETVLAGLTFIRGRPVLLGALTLDLVAVLLGGATALLPIYAKDILHVGPQGLGLLRAAPAVGALLMAAVLTRWPLQRHVGMRMLAAVAVFGLGTVVFGLSTDFGLSMVALAVVGAADSVSVVTRQTLIQLETPDDIRGRVAAVNSIFIGASNQLGEFESGATAALMGPVPAVVVGGVGTMVVAALWVRLFPALAQRDRMV